MISVSKESHIGYERIVGYLTETNVHIRANSQLVIGLIALPEWPETPHTEKGCKLVQRLKKDHEPVANFEQALQVRERRTVVIFAPKQAF